MESDHILTSVFQAVMVACVVAYALSIAAPLVVLFFKRYYSVDLRSTAWKCLGLSAFVVLAELCYETGTNLAYAKVIAVVVFLVCIANFLLSIFSFALRPRWLGGVIGSLSVLAWFIISAGIIIGAATADYDAPVADMGDGIYCRKSSYGLAVTDGGDIVDIFTRHGFFELRILNQPIPDNFPKWRNDVSAANLQLIDRCDAALAHASRPLSGGLRRSPRP